MKCRITVLLQILLVAASAEVGVQATSDETAGEGIPREEEQWFARVRASLAANGGLSPPSSTVEGPDDGARRASELGNARGRPRRLLQKQVQFQHLTRALHEFHIAPNFQIRARERMTVVGKADSHDRKHQYNSQIFSNQ